jgi:hypothetical protein
MMPATSVRRMSSQQAKFAELHFHALGLIGAEATRLVLGAGTFRDAPSEAQHTYALFPSIIDS